MEGVVFRRENQDTVPQPCYHILEKKIPYSAAVALWIAIATALPRTVLESPSLCSRLRKANHYNNDNLKSSEIELNATLYLHFPKRQISYCVC